MNNFLNLSTKFLETISNIEMLDYVDEFHRIRINDLLNELSGLDYKFLQIVSDFGICYKLIDALRHIPIDEDTLIVKSCCLLVSMLQKNTPIQIPTDILRTTVLWIVKSIHHNREIGITDALEAIRVLIKGRTENCLEISDCLLSPPNGLLISLLLNPNVFGLNTKRSAHYENSTRDEIKLATITCIEPILAVAISVISEHQADIILNEIIQLIYQTNPETYSTLSFGTLLTAALNSCRYLCMQHSALSEKYAGELIGAAKAFLLFGLPDSVNPIMPPVRVTVSQQALGEPVQSVSLTKGGKVAKKKRPRIRKDRKKASNCTAATSTVDKLRHSAQNAIEKDSNGDSKLFDTNFGTDENFSFFTINSTSQSDFSEAEGGGSHGYRHRQKYTAVRLSAINVIGALGKCVQTKCLFGYWHSLFPVDAHEKVNFIVLFDCVLKDPNIKCRMAALQALSLILLDSKPFLTQAEYRSDRPQSYIPFSICLGDMIIRMYEAVIQALNTENSTLVLVQLLTFLTVLIQATPFKRLQAGFMPKLVSHLKKLIFHSEFSITIGTLKVLEFLIQPNDISDEICACFGLMPPIINNRNVNQNYDEFVKHLSAEILVEEQNLEFTEDELFQSTDGDENQITGDVIKERHFSWLVEIVLTNVGLQRDNVKRTSKLNSTNIRTQSWLILTTMASQYVWLKMEMDSIKNALKMALTDPLAEIKLNGITFLDVFGNSWNTYLLAQDTVRDSDIESAISFWKAIIPNVVSIMHDDSMSSQLKAICCDAFSNIQIHVYEKLRKEDQILLISLMSGYAFDPDDLIRGAAIRALAVYVHFPSLRDDVCYVENISEAVIRALQDSGVREEVRIKASWALGNITDAIVSKLENSTPEFCVTDDLLFRLIEASLTCKSSDKVRSNGVRAIGKLLRLITVNQLDDQSWEDICFRAIKNLHQCCTGGGYMKVKWNACYAIGNLMKNANMFDETLLKNKRFNWTELIIPVLTQLVLTCSNFKVRINAAAALAVPSKRRFILPYKDLIWKSLLEAMEQSDHITDLNEYQHRDNLKEQLCISIAHYILLLDPIDLIATVHLINKYETLNGNWTRIINRMLPEKAAPLLEATGWLKDLILSDSEQQKALVALRHCFSPPMEYTQIS